MVDGIGCGIPGYSIGLTVRITVVDLGRFCYLMKLEGVP